MKTSPKTIDVFARAHELKGEARTGFLTEVCGDDTELRQEVQQLLDKAEKANSFFGDDEGETLLANDLEGTGSEGEGDQIGPYVLRQQIGEGGFGTVWMAEQSEPISRMVAVKVVKAGMDTKQVLARFGAERQALAMMDHPNIAKVLDAGATQSGRPYFAMELVKGIPITQFCDDQNYDHRQRLELFRDVCSAVNHAHQKGIIHRDLKPSNVMVTLVADEPVIKVIDFGIAKAVHSKLTDKTLFTRFEQFLGTPIYMSPEQAAMSALDVDTRSDIYCLGVLLYELLAGAPPFDQKSLLSADYDEMRRIIREDEPPSPSTRLTQIQSVAKGPTPKQYVQATSLRGELDWIVMKAIEKDRTRRYETASELARDIDRYLADEPVLAAAPSRIYQLRKFARRHKAAIGTIAALVVVLLAGIATTAWQAVEATKEKNRAVAAEDLAEERLGESEDAREDAVAARKEAELAREKAEQAEALAGQRLEETDAARKEAEQFSKVLKATLEKQMFGYWVVDLEKTPMPRTEDFFPSEEEIKEITKEMPAASAKEFAEEIAKELQKLIEPGEQFAEEIFGSITFEIKKGEILGYAGRDKPESAEFALENSKKAGNTLIMEIPGEDETSEVTIERDRLTLKSDDQIMILKRISKQEFEKRLQEYEADEADGEESEVAESEILPVEFEESQLKRALSKAAAMDSEVFEEIATGEIADLEAVAFDSDSLTGQLMLSPLWSQQEGQAFFFRFETPLDQTKFAEALNHSPDLPVSALHPDYITGLEHKIDGDSLTGRVEFEAKNGAFEGALGFEAVRTNSENDGWLINAFVLWGDNLRMERKGEDEPWKLNKPAPGEGNHPAGKD